MQASAAAVSHMAERIDHPRFIALLKERFPEVAATIDACAQGLLHPEMATLPPRHPGGDRQPGQSDRGWAFSVH
jgi:hypothetical protein